jgi:flagellar biosynthesis protein FliQ
MFFGLVASVVSALPSALIYLSDPAGFTPLHLVGKSQTIVPPVLYVVMALLTLALLVIGASLVIRGKLDLVEFATLVFAPHIVFLSVSALVFGGWDFFNWEAGHYLYVLTPGLAYSVAKVVSNRSEAGGNNARL